MRCVSGWSAPRNWLHRPSAFRMNDCLFAFGVSDYSFPVFPPCNYACVYYCFCCWFLSAAAAETGVEGGVVDEVWEAFRLGFLDY